MESNLNRSVAAELESRQDELVAYVLERQFELQPGLAESYDDRQMQHCRQDVAYNLSYLAQAIQFNSSKIFLDYTAWLNALLNRLGLPTKDLINNFESIKQVLSVHLDSEAYPVVATYLDPALESLRSPDIESSSFIEPVNPLFARAQSFLELILAGDRLAATSLILQLADEGQSIKSIYLNILQPVQREIGLLWQTGKITVAQEHYCTSITQLAISRLYPYIFAEHSKGKTLIATCVSGELHEIGLRMLSDIFELEGWDTWYLGANMPIKDVIQTIKDKAPHLIAVSATMTFHLTRVSDLIAQIREAGIKTPIMVGGYPFNLDPELWKEIGADAYAKDAEEALEIANKLAGCS